MRKRIKVLIADDSAVYRSQIRIALGDFPWAEVVGSVANGRLALERLQQTDVDVLILDMEMPEMDGLQTLQEMIRSGKSCKTLVFSGGGKKAAENTLEAFRFGASDFVIKPGSDSNEVSMVEPKTRIKSVLEPKLRALFPEATAKLPVVAVSKYPQILWNLFCPEIVVIGSSTGGPTVLEKIFGSLRGPLSCPVLIVQHMPPIFTATLAERLQKLSGIPAAEAMDGEVLQKNRVYIAPGDFHMSVRGTTEQPHVVLDQNPQVNSVRPAVDPLFESVARIYKKKCLAVILTGMGADGKFGAEKVKSEGGAVLIQDAGSCVVFGMPGAVMAAGAYDQVMDPAQITAALQDKIGLSQTANLKFVF